MTTELSRTAKTLNYYLFNKIVLIISISVADFLVNVILSEICFEKYTKNLSDPSWTNLSLNYTYNITCNTNYNNESDSGYISMPFEDFLSQKSLICLRYLKYRFCSNFSHSTSNCFPISKNPNFNLDYSYSKTFSEEESKSLKTQMLMYLLPTVKVCLEAFQVTIKETSVCIIPRFKDHIFRLFPIIIHSASVVELVRAPQLRFSYGNSILFYVSCLLVKSVFNVTVVTRAFMDYHHVCMMIGITLHLSWLLSQAWQIVISYRIWKRFKSGLANTRPLRIRQGDTITHYPIAWSLPIVIVLFTLSMDLIPGIPDNIRPGIGVCKCWFIDEHTRMIYAAVPAALAEIIALVMFLATLYHFKSARALTRSLQRSDSRRHCSQETQWVMIYIKVSFLTGASYILVTFLALYTLNYKVSQGVPSYIISTVKDVERLRGFEIFYIFVLNKKHFLRAPTSSNNEQSARIVENIPMINLRVASN